MPSTIEFPKDVESKAHSMGNDDSIDATEGNVEEVKRDLKSRHINMIAIAGMIVSAPPRSIESPKSDTKSG